MKNIILRKVTAAIVLTMAPGLTCQAESVAFEENFDGDWRKSFECIMDLDGQMPAPNVQAYFLSPESGSYLPWNVLKESSASKDRFAGSHSFYEPAGKSDDWMVSRAIEIPTEGYHLEFDAQSVMVRNGSKPSNLLIFITHNPVGPASLPEHHDFELVGISAGDRPGEVDGEWTHFNLPLDKWKGQTVFICFVNRNTDRDILVIDNVKVSRADECELTVSELPEYTFENDAEIEVTVEAVGRDIADCRLTIEAKNGETQTFVIPAISKGDKTVVRGTIALSNDARTDITVTLIADGIYPIVKKVSTTRLGFRTTHRVLIEETTGTWCANCPMGIYNIESLVHDPQYGDRVVPVSVHISGSRNDMMAMDDYADNLGITVAPMTRIDRQATAFGFTPAYDYNYDPTNPLSFAANVVGRMEQPAIMDIDIEAQWVMEGDQPVSVAAVAKVTPALTLADPSRYRVGFILTENNVGLDENAYWVQENGVSGYPIESTVGGWTLLPGRVKNMRYHFVARANPEFGGKIGSFTELNAGESYEVSSTIAIPDTYQEMPPYGMIAPAINPKYCEVTAYISDSADKTIVNCARVRMTDEPYELFSAADLVAASVDSIEAAQPVDGAVYDITGRKVADSVDNLTTLRPGIYLNGSRKILIR